MSASDYEQSDSPAATSLQPNDTATCSDLATDAGVQSLESRQLQDAPAIARRLTEVLGRMPCSCDKCDHKLPRSLVEERAHALDAARALYESPEDALFAAVLRAENDAEYEYTVEVDGPVLSATIDAARALYEPAPEQRAVADELTQLWESEDQPIGYRPTDAAWKRHDEQLALRPGLALLTNEEHTWLTAWVLMTTAGRS